MSVVRLILIFLATGVSIWAQRQYVISTVAGGASALTPGPAVNAAIGTPSGITIDGAGNVYFSSLHAFYKIDHSGVLRRIAGNGHAGNSGDRGVAINAQLNSPTGPAVDSKGNLYIADTGNNSIRKVTMDGIITSVAGSNFAGYYGDGGPATGTAVNQPTGVAVDGSGNLYIADSFNDVVREVSGGVISTVVGTGMKGYAGDGGPANAANLYDPTIRKVSGGNISTVAGSATSGYAGDGGNRAGGRYQSGWIDQRRFASSCKWQCRDPACDRWRTNFSRRSGWASGEGTVVETCAAGGGDDRRQFRESYVCGRGA